MHSFNSEVKPVEIFADGLGASEKSRVKGHKLYRKIRKLRFLIKTLFLEKKKNANDVISYLAEAFANNRNKKRMIKSKLMFNLHF